MGDMAKLVVELLVSDFAQSLKFYMEVLGFQQLYERPEEAFAYLDRHGARIFLAMEEKWYRRDALLLGVRQFIVLDPDGYLLRLSQSLGTRAV